MSVADTCTVQSQTRLLKQLVAESLYTVQEREVADAILLRAQAKRTLPGGELRSDENAPATRSFRRGRRVLSFRLGAGSRQHLPHP